MKSVNILNPAAGKGTATAFRGEGSHDEYLTDAVGDGERFAYEKCLAEPDTHFYVFGGDGTINEIVNGIMRANAGQTAKITVMPTGTGNDFVRNLPDEHGSMKVDLIKYNDRYAANMINIGFDCDVVAKTADYKKLPGLSGSGAYIFGVLNVLSKKMGKHFRITLGDENDKTEVIENDCLLAFIANGGYCGGGFFSAPVAKLDDGLLDVLIVKKVSRLKFLSLISDYRKGTHIDPETKQPVKKFADVLQYRKVKKVIVEGMKQICADGEVEACEKISVSVLPRAVTFSY